MPAAAADPDFDQLLTAAQRAADDAYALHDSSLNATALVTAQATASAAALEAVNAAEAAAEGDAVWDRHELQARLLYLRGKALASAEGGQCSLEAERTLADAVKLDPKIEDAWNCLGECFWQRGELETARHVFLGALEHARTSTTLCHLSMLLRSMSGALGREESLLMESVTLAKEAARIDPTSAQVWTGLGAAHLSVHLNVTSAAEDLHLANRAFTQAARAMAPAEDADLCTNHGTVCMLLDLYEPSLAHFTRAHELDPELGADKKRQAAWQSVVQISDAIAAKQHGLKGEAKHQKLVQMLADLELAARSGAGGGGPPPCLLSQLTLGENPGRTVLVKVLLPVPQTGIRLSSFSQCLIVADQNADLMALTAYALRGLPTLEPGTTLEVREPLLLRIEARRSWEATAQADVAGFHLLRVEMPSTQLRINGHPVQQAAAARVPPRRR